MYIGSIIPYMKPISRVWVTAQLIFLGSFKVPHPTAVESIVKERCTEGLPSLNDPGSVEVGCWSQGGLGGGWEGVPKIRPI